MTPMSTEPRPLLFDAVLYPYRSLSPTGFAFLIGAIALVSFAAGIVFCVIDAWPIVGFLGLDVLLVYVAFWVSYRSARLSEHVRLSEHELLIERISPRGRVRTWVFQPYWVRGALDESSGADNRLVITSHGRAVTIGDFLPPDERLEVAAALRDALGNLKNPAPDPLPA
ncbi:MAG: DUF2244 domain-containing protein [Alphaproteobacteria bacterium]|nr:DUF2244 domain-containing protein [Alphaproteobacteria bacterium]